MYKASATLIVIGIIITIVGFVPIPYTKTIQENERVNVDLGYVSPWTYTVQPGNAPWLEYTLKNGTIINATMVISGGSGNDIDFYIKDSAGNLVFNPGRVSYTYSYYFQAPKDDYYRVYMDNSFSLFSSKTIVYTVNEAYYLKPVTKTITDYQSWQWLIPMGLIVLAIGIGLAFYRPRSKSE